MYQKNLNLVNLFFRINLILIVYQEQVLSIDQSVCGDWETFRDEKCYNVVNKEDLQTFENALKTCSQLGTSSLLTIFSKEEQDFVSELIFNKYKIKENVWLGAKRVNSSSFKWSDDSDINYSNWAENKPTKELNRNCIGMKSEFDFKSFESLKGKWTDIPCDKKAIVVCEKIQYWPIPVLQNQLLNAEKNLKELTNRLIYNENKLMDINDTLNRELNERLKESKESFDKQLKIVENQFENKLFESEKITRNLMRIMNITLLINIDKVIPNGFVFFQLPLNKPPQEIWPQYEWLDISSQYANMFFRVIGNKSESFDQIQDENAPMLKSVMSKPMNEIVEGKRVLETFCPKNGWSNWVFTGADVSISHRFTAFYCSGGEVRPQNRAIKVWQRIN